MSEENEKIEIEKDIRTTRFYWVFLGLLGGHRFYFNKMVSAIIMLMITVSSLLLWGTAISNFGFMVVIIWWVIDVFLIKDMLKEHYERKAESAMSDSTDKDKKESSETIAEKNAEPSKKGAGVEQHDNKDTKKKKTKPISSDTLALINFESEKRNTGFAYLLFFFFGIFGAHRLYLEDKLGAALMIFLNLGSSGIALYLLFWPLEVGTLTFIPIVGFVCFFIMWIGDLFDIPNMVKEYNQELIKKIKNGDRDE